MAKRAAIYLRVSTDAQTTENQERALREVAARSGHEIVAVYRDDGISGAKGRDKRPGFDAMHKDASRRKFDIVMVGRSARSQPSRPNRLPLRAALTRDRPCPASTGHRHHDARRQGHVSNDWRVCRVRTQHDRRAGARWCCQGQGERHQERQSLRPPPSAGRDGTANPRRPGDSWEAWLSQDRGAVWCSDRDGAADRAGVNPAEKQRRREPAGRHHDARPVPMSRNGRYLGSLGQVGAGAECSVRRRQMKCLLNIDRGE